MARDRIAFTSADRTLILGRCAGGKTAKLGRAPLVTHSTSRDSSLAGSSAGGTGSAPSPAVFYSSDGRNGTAAPGNSIPPGTLMDRGRPFFHRTVN